MKETISDRAPHVLALEAAENQFLQVLVHEFTLKKNGSGQGARLRLKFGPKTPAIWHRSAKAHVQKQIHRFSPRAQGLQRKIDRILFENGKEELKHSSPDFPFRYASGGVLPVISMGSNLYYG
ncbi:MAG TPA: hypothetical protein VMN36_01425 [Verrucomicrobiales bacterium]|nr:hypothetical protein [Verrucomicrobiales bacterium]